MLRRIHSALVCEPALLAALGDVSTLAITRRERDPLRRFWIAQRARFREFDSVQVARDFSLSKRLVVCASRIAPLLATSRAAQTFAAAARRAPLSSMVYRTGQRLLRRRIERLERALELEASQRLVEQELQHSNCALAALETADMTRADKKCATYEELLAACCVVGLDGDIGLGLVPDAIVSIGTGRPLFALPYIGATERPAKVLYDRVVATFGKFGAAEANQLFEDDALEMTGLRTVPRHMRGVELREAVAFAGATARQLERQPKQHDGDDWTSETKVHSRFGKRLDQFREWLKLAAEGDYAVVEWVTETPRSHRGPENLL